MSAQSTTGTSKQAFSEVKKQKIAGIAPMYEVIAEYEARGHKQGLSAAQVQARMERKYPHAKKTTTSLTAARLTDLNKSGLIYVYRHDENESSGRQVQFWRTASEQYREDLIRVGAIGHEAIATSKKMIRTLMPLYFGDQAHLLDGFTKEQRRTWKRMINEVVFQFAKTLTPRQLRRMASDPVKFRRLACEDYTEDCSGGHKPLPEDTVRKCLRIKRKLRQ